MSDVVGGLCVVLVASVLQGSFMVPMSYVKKWEWENSWALFSVLGMVGFNWVLAMVTIPSLLDVYRAAPATALATPAIFGLCWGIGAVCFGLGVAAAGFGLGYSIIMGIVLSFGAFIPMAVQHQEEILTTKGFLTLASLAAMLVGIAVFGKAGTRKEQEQSEKTGAITKTSSLSFKVGLAVCIVGGLLSCLTNVGFALSESIVDLAKDQGVADKWAGNSVWTILFTSGALANLAYCAYLFVKNKSFRAYREPGLVINVVLVAFMSLMWIGSFVLYGLGAGMMGDWGNVVGWSVFIALSITIANLWGLGQGEWANTTAKTRTLMGTGLGILVVAIIITAISNLN